MKETMVRLGVLSADPEVGSAVSAVAEGPDSGCEVVISLTPPIHELRSEDMLKLQAARVHAVVLDLGTDPTDGLQLTRFLTAQDASRPVILVGPTMESSLLLEGMRAGAQEYLAKPVEEEALSSALERVRSRIAAEAAATPPGGGVAGRMVALASAKGGSGTTTTAVNLAVHLGSAYPGRTLLVDLDDLGTATLLLGKWPRYSYLDLISNMHRMDEKLLDSLLEKHESGVAVLPSPQEPMAGEPVDLDTGRKLMKMLKRHYPYLVVDLGRRLGPLAMAALEEADDAVLVANAEIPSINNLKRLLPAIERVAQDPDRGIRIVLNRYLPDDEVTLKEFAEAIGREVYAILPRDEVAVAHAANSGKPVVLDAGSRYGRDLRKFGTELTGVSDGEGKGKGLRGALRSLVRRNGKA